MLRAKCVVILLVTWLGAVSIGLRAQTVPSTYFGMHMNSGVIAREPWPAVRFGSDRLWDTSTGWADVNPSPGIYRWAMLDDWLNTAKAHGITDILYTFGQTPPWASSKPTDTICFYAPGECDPPNDLESDGTGTNQHWKSFVTAIATHAAGRIKYWEIWNEPHNAWYWNGTMPQLVRMAKDAAAIIKSIDPNAVIVSPSPGIRSLNAKLWMANYLAAGGGQFADIIAFHGYVQGGTFGVYPQAADIVPLIATLKQTLQAYGQGAKPIWDTEASWGRTVADGFTSRDLQAGFLVQFFLLQWSSGVKRFYWYEYNNTDLGTLWIKDPTNPTAPGTFTKAGIAYQQVNSWMVGATLTQPCSQAADSTWNCVFTRLGGYQAEAIWNASVNKTVTAPSQYHHYRDIYGNLFNIPTDGAVGVGYKPILLLQ